MEERVKSMEQLTSVVSRSLKTAGNVRMPPKKDFETRRRYYVNLLVEEKQREKAMADTTNYDTEKLQQMFQEKREGELRQMLTSSIQKENEIDDIYMTAINAKLDMLEKRN